MTKRRCVTCQQVIRKGVPRPVTAKQRCSECDAVGHNVRGCPQLRDRRL